MTTTTATTPTAAAIIKMAILLRFIDLAFFYPMIRCDFFAICRPQANARYHFLASKLLVTAIQIP
jgi:hypothetical protein